MNKGWALSLKGLAIAAMLSMAGGSLAQDAAPAAVTAAPTIEAVAPPAPGDVVASSSAAVAAAAAQHSAAQTDAALGYTRMAPTPGIGQPVPKGFNLQEQFTPIGQEAKALTETIINPIIGVISVFVLALMFWVVFRYRSGAVESPSTTTHNFTIEVIWTLVPALILLFIAFPSFRLLANQYSPPQADLTIKVTGYQWYWGYEYPDYGDISFDSVMLPKAEAESEGTPYLLEVDNRIVVPAGATVKLLITAADVLHSFAVPSFWVKMDAVPGKVNEAWFKVDRPGVYYGQCSELCGTKHGFMPIAVEVLEPEAFRRWVRMRQAEAGIEPTGPGIAPEQVAVTPAAAASAVRAAIAPASAPQITTPEATNTQAPAAAAAAPAA